MRRHAGAEVEGDADRDDCRSRRAIGAALLEAGDMRVAEIPAARALGEIAAERGEMADLRRREAARGGGDAGIGGGEARVGGDRGNGGKAPMRSRAVRAPCDAASLGRGSDDRSAGPSRRRCGGVRRGRCRRRGIRPCAVWWRCSCCGPPFQCRDQPVRPDRQSPSAARRWRCGSRWRPPATSAPSRPRRCRRCRRARDRNRPRRNARRSRGVSAMPGMR